MLNFRSLLAEDTTEIPFSNWHSLTNLDAALPGYYFIHRLNCPPFEHWNIRIVAEITWTFVMNQFFTAVLRISPNEIALFYYYGPERVSQIYFPDFSLRPLLNNESFQMQCKGIADPDYEFNPPALWPQFKEIRGRHCIIYTDYLFFEWTGSPFLPLMLLSIQVGVSQPNTISVVTTSELLLSDAILLSTVENQHLFALPWSAHPVSLDQPLTRKHVKKYCRDLWKWSKTAMTLDDPFCPGTPYQAANGSSLFIEGFSYASGFVIGQKRVCVQQ
jgi:hypothetical protein